MEPSATSSPAGHRQGTQPIFSPAEMADLRKEHSLSLIAKVLHKKVGPQKLRSHLLWLWSREGNRFIGTLHVFPLENDFVQLKFSDPFDYKMALEGVPWLIDDHYISLRPWVPNFKPSAAVITKTEVWVRFPELPTEYYKSNAFLRIATVVGKLIKVDLVTENKRKCKYARLCIELDLTCPLPPHVELDGGFLQPIEYEGIHVLCYQCGCVGHLKHECINLPSLHELASNELFNHSSYGPWIIVPPRRSVQELQANTPVSTTSMSGSRFHVLEQEDIITNKFKKKPVSELSTSTLPVSKTDQQFHVLKQENVTNKFEKNPLSKRSTSSVIPEVIHSAVSKIEHVPNIRLEESNELDWTQILSKMEGPSSSSSVSKPKLLPDFYSLESSSTSDSPKESLKLSPPPMCANDEFFVKGVLRGTQDEEINDKKVQIVEHSTQGRPTVFTMNSDISGLDICLNISPLPGGNGNEHQIGFIPSGTHDATAPKFGPRKILSWNCRGAGDPKVRTIRNLCETHKPSIVLLFETKIDGDDVKNVIEKLGFSSLHCIDSVGFIGRVWILWHQEEVVMAVTRTILNQVEIRFLPHLNSSQKHKT